MSTANEKAAACETPLGESHHIGDPDPSRCGWLAVPDFVRLAWASEQARDVWAARLKRLIVAWAEIERLSTSNDLRNCALVRGTAEPEVPPGGGFAVQPLDAATDHPDCSTRLPLHYFVGKLSCAPLFHAAWLDADWFRIGELLGYPICCRRAFLNRCVSNRSIDPTWAMVTDNELLPDRALMTEVRTSYIVNTLVRPIGIRAVPHLPCSAACQASIEFGQKFLDLGIRLGFSDEIAWLKQILSLPMEWSALHGIAEIRTPLFKVLTRTDFTAVKLVIRRVHKKDYPGEAPCGHAFPFRAPQGAVVAGSATFQRGIAEPVGGSTVHGCHGTGPRQENSEL